MPFIIEDDETPQPQGRYVIEGDSTALQQATSPSRTPKETLPSGQLAAALSGVGAGLGGFATLAKYLGRELYETPSRIGQMISEPSIIPGVAAQTGREALALVTDPKAIVAGVGTALGGPSAGTAGAVGYQTLHDVMRRLGGAEVSPEEMTKHLTETLTSFGAPQAVGQLSRLGGPALRAGVRAIPGSAAALQKNVMAEARQAVAGVPRPPVPATAEELAAGRAAQAEQAAAEQAVYQASLRQARAAGVERIREAGQLPVVEKPYAELEAMGETMRQLGGGQAGLATRQGILRETVPTPLIQDAVSKEAENLKPLIAAWKLSPNPRVQQSAAALEKHLEGTGSTMSLDQVIRFMRDVGPLTRRGGETGGAASQLYKAATEDLKAHGSDAAQAALKAAQDYKRTIAVKELQDRLASSIKSKGGKLVPSADTLIRVLQSPGTRAEKFFAKRLQETTTAEERANLLTDLRGAMRIPPKPAKAAVTGGAPPKKITSLQEVLEASKEPIAPFGENVDITRVLRQLPSEGAVIGTESPLAEFLRQKMSREDVATLRAQLERLQAEPRVTGGSPSYLERLPVYTVLAPLLSALGFGAMGGGGGAAAVTIPASILAAEAATRGLKHVATTPRMQRALLRAYLNRVGQRPPRLGGTTAGILERLTREQE